MLSKKNWPIYASVITYALTVSPIAYLCYKGHKERWPGESQPAAIVREECFDKNIG